MRASICRLASLACFALGLGVLSGCGSADQTTQFEEDVLSPAGLDTSGASVAANGSYQVLSAPSTEVEGEWDFSVASTRSSPTRDNYRFVWDFDDGVTAEGRVVSHAFAEPGSYSVRVTALRSRSTVVFVLTTVVVIEAPVVETPEEDPVAPAGDDPVAPAGSDPPSDPDPIDPVEPGVDDPVVVNPGPQPEPTPTPPPPTDQCTTDADADGVMDCNDGCPNDPRKGAPGVCGCGTPDTDADGDATPNCNDLCPNDSNKIAAGVCGCGTPDTDANNNGTADCNDPPPSSNTLGMNVAKIYGWGSQIVFVDVFKQSRVWESMNATGGSITSVVVPTNALGYPLQIPYSDGVNPPQIVRTIMLDVEAGTYPTGTYTLMFEGDGDIVLGRAGAGTYTSSGAPRTVSFNVTNNTSGITLAITRSNAANPIRNIHVIMPGHLSTWQTQPFYPPLLARMQGFSVIRHMDWIRTNGQRRLVNWSDRPTVDHVTHAGPYGGAYEYAIRLSNAVEADSWLTVPHLATDDFVRELAQLALAELASGRKVYVEYSNEVWNGMFDQTVYVRDTGVALGLHTNTTTAGRRYTAKRSAEIFRIFEEEFGAQSNRVVKVLAAHAANAGVATEILSTFQQASVNGVPVNPWGVTASVLAIAPYFGNGLADEIVTNNEVNTVTTAQILQRARDIYMPMALDRVSANKVVADTYGLPLISYEGGQHIVGTGNNVNNATLASKLHAANRDPGMYDLYRDYIDGYFARGGTLFVHFNFSEGFDQYGSWGSMEYLDQPLSQAPKYQALLDAMGQ